MSATSHLPLTDEIREQVIVAQHEVHRKFWKEFATVAHSILSGIIGSSIITGSVPEPRVPKQPIRLCAVLKRYAIELFKCEHIHYPVNAPDLFSLRSSLASKVEKIVIANILEFEQKGLYSLTWHASIDVMAQAVRIGLEEHIKTLIVFLPIEFSEPKLLAPAMIATSPSGLSTAPALPPLETIGERLDRAALVSGHKTIWSAIGISRSSYFEVKAGRGGRKAKAKVEVYLSGQGNKSQ
jgi:hypothetical protein